MKKKMSLNPMASCNDQSPACVAQNVAGDTMG